ncbi:antigen WC1.1-like [Anguilla rostrata]|uniref:antigen WC1.1-like n=1 Tax=Anguilla rostrata TaxID=7938 RepID=UPI0030D4DD73
MQWFAVLSSLVLLCSLVRSRQLRLVGGWRRGGCSGLVEVRDGGRWGRLCFDRRNPIVARLVCLDAGCGELDFLRPRRGDRATSGVQLLCEGQETTLRDCLWRSQDTPCDTELDMVCTDGVPSEPVSTSDTPRQQQRTPSLTSSSLPCSFAAAPPSGQLFSVLYASLVLCGLAVMVAAVLTVEVLARRRRSARPWMQDLQ